MSPAMPACERYLELDTVELWVSNLERTKQVLTRFGFTDEATSEGRSDEDVARLVSGGVSLIVRQGTSDSSAIARHVAAHGDGVGDVNLVCDDIGALVDRALAHGLKTSTDGACAQIDLLGDGNILHTIRDRKISPSNPPNGDPGLQMRAVDHVTYCLPFGSLNHVARAYREVFGLEPVDVGDCREVGDTVTGMQSVVLRSARGFTVVLTEPMSATSTGQTQHFVQQRAGAGVQHVAIAYDDLAAAVQSLRSNGVLFLAVPHEHLEHSHRRLHDRALPWDALRREEILVDADEEGLLFQLFTRPITDGSGFFFELIQREGATGFGAANVRALFAAVEASVPHDRERRLS